MSQPLVKRTVRYSAIILLMIFTCKTGQPLPGRTVQYNVFLLRLTILFYANFKVFNRRNEDWRRMILDSGPDLSTSTLTRTEVLTRCWRWCLRCWGWCGRQLVEKRGLAQGLVPPCWQHTHTPLSGWQTAAQQPVRLKDFSLKLMSSISLILVFFSLCDISF